MDGRDTDPGSRKGFIADLQQHINEVGTGAIASIIGRFYTKKSRSKVKTTF